MSFPGFDVQGQVAQGSTGVVWQARQVELDRMVAIKELSPALLHAPGFLERFRAEAQTLAGLDDPHVVRIYDYVEEPQRAYLVQEWVDGAPLATVLEQHGRLSAEQSLGVLRGGLMGLAHAHQRGLVHRDVSPANILLDREGVSKLVDFGLAARTEEGITPGAATSVGTPAFASPEAVTGAPMTTRSDVYSAAAVLFLLLSGRLPYPGDTNQVLQAHTSAPVPKLDGHGPELAGLLARGMAKNPDQRPADAAAFLAELEQAATQRYGAGWLDRASVAGLVTATTAATGTAAVTASSAGASAAAPAAAQALAYGSTATPTTTTAQLAAGTTARTGARILGMPLAAAIVALVLLVAGAATTIIVTNNNPVPSAREGGRTPVGQQAGTNGGPGSTPQPEPDSGSILYSGTLTITGGGGGGAVPGETEIGVFCSDVDDCNLVGFTFGGHDIIRLVRDGPGTFSAVLDGPGLTSCDSAEGPFPTTVTISFDESTMTMTGHSDGQTLVCGESTLIVYEENVTFQGTYASGDLPDL